jgi:hypothetical protein
MILDVYTRKSDDDHLYHEVRTPQGGHFKGIDDDLAGLIELVAIEQRRLSDEMSAAQEAAAGFVTYCQRMEAGRTAEIQIGAPDPYDVAG